MTDVTVDQATEDTPEPEIWEIPVPKAGKGQTIPVNINNLHDKTYRQALFLGLKALAVRKMTKLASTKDMQGKELETHRAAIMKVAAENVQDMYEGKIRSATGSAKEAGVSREVKTEAMRQAKVAIKGQLKAAGKKVSYIPVKTITAAAKKLVDSDPTWYERAAAALAAAEKERQGKAIDITGIEEDETLIAKAEETKKAKGGTPRTAPPKQKARPEARAN